MLYRFLRLFVIFMFKLLFHLEARGVENIPKRGGFILASNHASYLDPIVLGAACPRMLNFMARYDLFFNPLFSRLITSLGAFPVKKGVADLSAFKEAIHRIKNGNALVVFPEGRREFAKDSFSLLPPQPGIGFLVARLKVAVIPAFIKGAGKALPRRAKFIRPTKILVYFGKPRAFNFKNMPHIEKEQGKEILVERSSPYQDIARTVMEDIRRLSCQALN